MPDVKVKEWGGLPPMRAAPFWQSAHIGCSCVRVSCLMAGSSDGEGHCSGSGVVAVQANAAEGHY